MSFHRICPSGPRCALRVLSSFLLVATRRKGQTASMSKPHARTGGRTLGIDAGVARIIACDRASLPSCASAPMIINGKVQPSSTCIKWLHSLTDVASDKMRFSSCCPTLMRRSPAAADILVLYHRWNGRPTWHGLKRKLHRVVLRAHLIWMTSTAISMCPESRKS